MPRPARGSRSARRARSPRPQPRAASGSPAMPGAADARSSLRLLVRDRQGQQRRAESLAVRVERERAGHAATEGTFEHEVERAESRELVPGHAAAHDSGEVRLHAFGRHVTFEQRVVGRIERDHRDVRRVALVAGARVRDVAERAHAHVPTQATEGRTAPRGTKADATAITSRVDFMTPPPPAGPFVYSVSISSPMRRASVGLSHCAVMRARTSYGSPCAVESASPCSAFTPMRSSRSSLVRTPVIRSRSATTSSASRARATAPGPAYEICPSPTYP